MRDHDENFSVISRLLPADLRDDVANVYAFCRRTHDLGDKSGDSQRSLDRLASWRQELSACYEGRPRHAVYIALRDTIEKHDIPRQPFDDLIDAAVQDQTVTRYRTWDQVVDHCTRSANPVGRLALYVAGHRDPQRQQLADATSTALALTHFWQDVQRDLVERNRVYLPDDVATRHGLDIATMVKVGRSAFGPRDEPPMNCRCAERTPASVTAILPAYRATIRELIGRTWPLFERGRELWPLLDSRVRPPARLLTYGGESILRKIQRQRYDTFTCRPRVNKAHRLGLMLRVLPATLASR